MSDWLEDVYAKHRQGLFSLAVAITGSREEAEDAVHDAFARLCRDRRNTGRKLADPVPYVYAAVRNAACDRRRACGRNQPGGAGLFRSAAAADDPVQPLIQSERHDELQQAVAALPEEKRQVVVMKIFGQLTFQQVAAALDEPLSTVATRYQRALDDLREALGVRRT